MKKLLFGLLLLACCLPASAGFYNKGEGFSTPVVASGGGPTKSYSFESIQKASSAGTVNNFTVSLSIAPSSTRIAIVGVYAQNNPTITSVVLNGASLTSVATTTASGLSLWAGVVTSGTSSLTLAITATSNNFGDYAVTVWDADGLNSNTSSHNASGAGPQTISVSNGDFMFATDVNGSAGNFNGSTVAPSANHTILTNNAANYNTADWSITSTNASFSLSVGDAHDIIAATWN